MSDQYYLQDKRQFVGNSMSWWRQNGAGYCCDIREAHVFTKDEAFAQHRMRETDVPWPKAYIDARIANHVDFQRVDLDQARRMYSAPETRALCPHGMPLAENVCGPCSEGRPNTVTRTVWTKTSDSDPYCIHCRKTWDMHLCDGFSSCPSPNR
jgi:hypothetical protein